MSLVYSKTHFNRIDYVALKPVLDDKVSEELEGM
jgi:hypothetical protein